MIWLLSAKCPANFPTSSTHAFVQFMEAESNKKLHIKIFKGRNTTHEEQKRGQNGRPSASPPTRRLRDDTSWKSRGCIENCWNDSLAPARSIHQQGKRAKGNKSTVAQSYTAAVGDDVQVAPDHGRIRQLRVGTLLQIESIYRADGVEGEELQIHVTNGTWCWDRVLEKVSSSSNIGHGTSIHKIQSRQSRGCLKRLPHIKGNVPTCGDRPCRCTAREFITWI